MNKLLEQTIKYLAGIGALNIGTSKFLDFNVLDKIPIGIVSTLIVAAIAVSGGYIVYWAWKKRI